MSVSPSPPAPVPVAQLHVPGAARVAAPGPGEPTLERVSRSPVRSVLRLVRVSQWPKNAVVLLVPLLAGAPPTVSAVAAALVAVVAFALVSSFVYVLNDLHDAPRDRLHPVKCRRPVAAGDVSVAAARTIAAVLLVAVVGLAAAARDLVPPTAWIWPALYLALNLTYVFKARDLPLLDIFVVAAGFPLRGLFGVAATAAVYPGWLLLSVFAACLVFALGKRRRELATVEEGGSPLAARPNLVAYSVAYLDSLVIMSGSVATVAYVLFAHDGGNLVSGHAAGSVVSAPFAMFALFRYLQLVMVESRGGSPTETLLHDVPLRVIALAWTACLLGSFLFTRLTER